MKRRHDHLKQPTQDFERWRSEATTQPQERKIR
jgi:hypothetical protein